MGDYVAAKAEQANNAAAQLGLTNVNRGRGQEALFWPNLTGSFAVKVIDYWIAEAAKVQGHVAAIPDSAIRTAWLRAVDVLRSQRGPALQAAPHALLPAPQAVLVWTSVDQVVLPLSGLSDTPTKWQLVQESVSEAVGELGSSTLTVLKLAAAAVIALLLLRWSR